MKEKKSWLAAGALLGLVLLLGAAVGGVLGQDEHGARERKVSLDQVPAAVRAAIHKAVGEGRLVDVGEITTPGGRVLYEIEMRIGGRECDVLFDDQGAVLSRQGGDEDGDGEEDEEDEEEEEEEGEEIALSRVPGEVKDVARRAVKGIELAGAERFAYDGVVYYELEGRAWGRTFEVVVAMDVGVVSVESEDEKDDD